jgi:hypothetical protein
MIGAGDVVMVTLFGDDVAEQPFESVTVTL